MELACHAHSNHVVWRTGWEFTTSDRLRWNEHSFVAHREHKKELSRQWTDSWLSNSCPRFQFSSEDVRAWRTLSFSGNFLRSVDFHADWLFALRINQSGSVCEKKNALQAVSTLADVCATLPNVLPPYLRWQQFSNVLKRRKFPCRCSQRANNEEAETFFWRATFFRWIFRQGRQWHFFNETFF